MRKILLGLGIAAFGGVLAFLSLRHPAPVGDGLTGRSFRPKEPVALTPPPAPASASATRDSRVAPDAAFETQRARVLYERIATDPRSAFAEMTANRSRLSAEAQAVEREISLRGDISVQIACVDTTPEIAATPRGANVMRRFTAANGEVFALHSWGPALDVGGQRDVAVHGFAIGDRLVVAPDYAVTGSFEGIEPGLRSAPLHTTGAKTLLCIRARFADEPESYEPVTAAAAAAALAETATFLAATSYGKLTLTSVVTSRVLALPDKAAIYAPYVVLPKGGASGDAYYFENLQMQAYLAARAADPAWNQPDYDYVMVVTSAKPGYGNLAGQGEVSGRRTHIIGSRMTMPVLAHELGHNLGLWHANAWQTDSVRPNGRNSTGAPDSEVLEYGHAFSAMSSSTAAAFADPVRPQFAPVEKRFLGWLGADDVTKVAATGTYRLHALEGSSGTRALRIERVSGDSEGAARKLWLCFRSLAYSNPVSLAPFGVQLDWCTDDYGSVGHAAIQLDVTPRSQATVQTTLPATTGSVPNPDRRDGILLLGKTFSDAVAGFHITPIALDPQGDYVDVRIEFDPAGNHAPVLALDAAKTDVAIGETVSLRATATDADGDTLHYSWDFGFGLENLPAFTGVPFTARDTPTIAVTWPAPGSHVITATASDGKGGIDVRKMLINVGNTNRVPTATASLQGVGVLGGRVLNGGRPVAGAIVKAARPAAKGTPNAPYADAYYTTTLLDGTYAFANLTPDKYTLSAVSDGLTLAPKFKNPVTVTAGQVKTGKTTADLGAGKQYALGKDFWDTANFLGIDDAHQVSGQITDATGAAVAGLTVALNDWTVLTDAKGAFVFPKVPAGTYTVEVESTTAYTPSARSVVVDRTDVTGVDFARTTYLVRGEIRFPYFNNPSPETTILVSNGQKSTEISFQYINGRPGTAHFSIPLPAGFWTMAVVAPHQQIAEGVHGSGEITVNSDLTPPILFAMLADNPRNPTGTLTGAVQNGTLGVRGVTVSVEGMSTSNFLVHTDDTGHYLIPNVPVGTRVVRVEKTGVAFATSRENVVVGEDRIVTKNFSVATPNARPTIATPPAAQPALLTGTGNTAMLSVLGRDDAGEGNLIYTWEVIAGPTLAYFEATNGTNAAKTMRATFIAFGAYTLRATIQDALGATATANVNVSVLPRADTLLTLSPYETFTPLNGVVAFTATSWDESGVPRTVTPTWNTPSAQPASGGLRFVAPGKIRLSASYHDLEATAEVTVLPP